MKMIPRKPNKTLKASAQRAPAMVDEYEDEPSMKLSSAFVVVLLLHLVAIGGIYAFNSIKARRAADQETSVAMEAASADSREAAAPIDAGGGRTHEVRPGDTLIRIAHTYGVTIDAIEKANSLGDSQILRVGQAITIPGASPVDRSPEPTAVNKPAPKIVEAAPPPAAPSSTLRSSGESYTVVKGDNPVAIARKFDVKYSDLLELNKIEDPRLLQIGQKLIIPVKHN